MKKWVTSLSLIIALLMLLTACGTAPSTTASTTGATNETSESITVESTIELKQYKIGCIFPNAGAVFLEQVGSLVDQLASLSGGTTLFASEYPASIDAQLTVIENLIAGGADGLVVIPYADSMLPAISQKCEEAGVYWAISMRQIQDEEIRTLVESSPYYVGRVFWDDVESGYRFGKMLSEKGYKKLAMISTVKGDATGDMKEEGLRQACAEFGMEIVAESRGQTQPAECAQAAESFLAAYSDLDCIVEVASGAAGGVDAVVQVISASGRDVRYATLNAPYDPAAFFDSGVADFYSRPAEVFYDFYMANIKVINAIQGTPILTKEGKPGNNLIHAYLIDNRDEGMLYAGVAQDPKFVYYTDEFVLENLFGWNNKDLDIDMLQNYMNTYDPLKMAPSLIDK